MNRLRHPLCLITCLVVGLTAAHRASAQYEFHSFDGSPGSFTEPFGVNASGLIAGQYNDASGNSQVFTLYQNVFTTLTVPTSVAGYAGGPNNAGQIPIGWADSSGNLHAAIAQNGSFTQIPDAPGYAITAANGINASGTLTGVVTNDLTFNTFHGFTYSGGAYTLFDYPGVTYTVASGINDAGTVVGVYVDAGGKSHGFEKDGSTFTSIDYSGADASIAQGISNDGVVEGVYTVNGSDHGYLLNNGVFTTIDYAGATNTDVTYRNSTTGELTGDYSTDHGQSYHGFYALAVPEPGSIALLVGMATVGVGVFRRKRR